MQLKRFVKLAAIAIAGISCSMASPAFAVLSNLNWDPSLSGGTATGGTGTWNSTNGNWLNSSSTDTTWTYGYNAIFDGGTAGTVSFGTAETANTLSFNTSGYTITGTSTLTLTGGTISVLPSGSAAINTTLGLSGSVGLSVLGGGTLSLGSKLTPSPSGTLNIGAGSLVLAQTSGTVTFNNGGTLNGNLVIVNSGVRVNFGSLVGSTGSLAANVATYNGSGSVQIQSLFVIISSLSGSYGGAIGAGFQLNSLGLPFTKTDVTQSTVVYPTSGAFSVAMGATKNGSLNGYLAFNGPIAGNSDVVFCTNSATTGGGAAVTLLGAQCTYTGTTFIDGNGPEAGAGGSLILGTSNAFPVGTDLAFGFLTGAPSHFPELDLNGNNTQIGSLCLASTTANLPANRGDFLIANNSVGTLATLTVSGNTTPANPFGGRIVDHDPSLSGGTLALVKAGPNTLTLSGTNTYSGGTTVSGGVLQVNSSSALGTGSLTASAGTVDLLGNSPAIKNLGGAGGTVTNSGSATSVLSITLSAPSTFGGVLADGANPLALAINGTGSITLSGSNSNYSGGTTLNSGALVVTGGSATGLGIVTLNGGTLASVPGGSIAGSVFGGSGPHTIAPSGTLVLGGNLSLNSNSTLAFNVTSSTSDSLQIGGVLSESGPLAVDINPSGTLSGTYTLATYATSSLNPGDFALIGAPAGSSLTVSSTELQLTVVPEPSTFVLLAMGAVALLGYKRRRGAN